MEPRAVSPGHGWTWIVRGFGLFRRSPGMWLGVVLLLFVASTLFLGSVAFGIVFLLLMPVFVAGLMDGCRALEYGERLQPGHLLSGFRHNGAQLVTIGGVWLVGNFAIMMLVLEIGGEAIVAMQKFMPKGTPPADITPEMREAARDVMQAWAIGMALSVPLVMAVIYAPLLVFFDNLKPWAAMKASFAAALRNLLPLFVFGALIFVGIVIATPFSIALRRYDLALWMLAPVVLPALYASYRDIFPAGAAEAPVPPAPPAPPTNA